MINNPEDHSARRAAEDEIERCIKRTIETGYINFPAIHIMQSSQKEERKGAATKMLEKFNSINLNDFKGNDHMS